jgi:hypothetical protein
MSSRQYSVNSKDGKRSGTLQVPVPGDGAAKHPELKCSGRMVGKPYLGITSDLPISPSMNYDNLCRNSSSSTAWNLKRSASWWKT